MALPWIKAYWLWRDDFVKDGFKPVCKNFRDNFVNEICEPYGSELGDL